MMIDSDRTGSLLPPPPTPPAPVVKPSTPSAVAETPGLWDRLRSYFSVEAAAEVPETKKPGMAEKLFCNQLGVTMACSDESIQEGLALLHGFEILFEGGKDFAAKTADAATDAVKKVFAMLEKSSPSAALRPRPRPVSLTAAK